MIKTGKKRFGDDSCRPNIRFSGTH